MRTPLLTTSEKMANLQAPAKAGATVGALNYVVNFREQDTSPRGRITRAGLTPRAPMPGRTIEGQEPAAKDNSNPAEQ